MAPRRRVAAGADREPRVAEGIVAEQITRGLDRLCQLDSYTPVAVPGARVDGQIIAYASPDSTFAVTRRLIQGATSSILIGTYDFTASYVADLLVAAVGRGVKVQLMLDLDGRSGEMALYDGLTAAGIRTHPAPACGAGHANYFPSCHEKVTVIDGEWVLVQSGNYTESSIPPNDPSPTSTLPQVPGNRDMGLAIQSKSLARFFTRLLKADIKRAVTNITREGLAQVFEPEVLMFEAAPPIVPEIVPDKTFTVSSQRVQAVVSPDNYVAVAEALLRSATKSIDIEQQYIRPTQPQVGRLLAAIKAARAANPKLRIRIIVAAGFAGADIERLRGEMNLLAKKHDLAFGSKVRLLNKKYFVHCHNKLIIVDGERVLVGSQNWSDFGVSRNREAGILVTHKGIADYFTGLVAFDWKAGIKTLPVARPKTAPTRAMTPAAVRVRYGDYADV